MLTDPRTVMSSFGEFLSRGFGGGINGSPVFVDHINWQPEFERLQELLCFPARCAVTNGDYFRLVGGYQFFDSVTPFRSFPAFVKVEKARFQQIPVFVETNGFAACSVAGVDGQQPFASQRCAQQ